jgi:uncharacterized protein YbaR (Trm112 family)
MKFDEMVWGAGSSETYQCDENSNHKFRVTRDCLIDWPKNFKIYLINVLVVDKNDEVVGKASDKIVEGDRVLCCPICKHPHFNGFTRVVNQVGDIVDILTQNSLKDPINTHFDVETLRVDDGTQPTIGESSIKQQKVLDRDYEIDKFLINCKTCIDLIDKKHGKEIPKKFILDSMKCPLCENGILCYTISDYNGHIHGKCTTEHCIQWME